MNAGAWIAGAVGVTVLLAFAGRILWAIHKGLDRWGNVENKVDELKAILNNGIRSEIRLAATRSEKAADLAADAARAASVAMQRAQEGREEIGRAVNAVRAELDVYTNVVLSDRQRIREALKDLGKDIGDESE